MKTPYNKIYQARNSTAFRYGVATVITFLALGLKFVLGPLIVNRFPFATLFVAVLISAELGGFGPALLSIIIGACGTSLWLFDWSHDVESNFAGLAIFTAISLGISYLVSRMRKLTVDLASQKEQLRATLDSIGDAIIVTDEEGNVVRMNPVAESLTGWPLNEAMSQPLETVFVIKNETTLQTVENPVNRVLKTGTIVGLANHTILISRSGEKVSIDDSAAPIRDSDGNIVGVILVFRDITERRGTETRWAETNARNTAILNTALDCIVSIDHKGTIIEFNPAAEKTFGYTREQALGKQMAELIIPPHYRDAHYRGLERFLRTGENNILNKRVELTALRADGTEFPAEIAIAPIQLANNRPTFTAYIRDLQYEKEQEKRRSVRLAVNQALTKILSSQNILPELLRSLGEVMNWHTAAYWVFDAAHEKLTCETLMLEDTAAMAAFADVTRTMECKLGEGLPGRIWEKRTPVWISDISQDNNFPRREVALKAGFKSAFGFPLLFEEQIVGVVEFFTHQPSEPDPDLLEIMSTVGLQLGQLLARRKMESSLQHSESRFANFMDQLPGLAWIKDQQGRYIYVNANAKEAFNATAETLIGKTDFDIFPEQTAKEFIENDKLALMRGIGVNMVETLKHADGTLRYSLVSKFPLKGTTAAEDLVGGVAIDITDRMHAEEALKESDRRKNEFIAMLGHELRNPLAPIRNALELLTKDIDPNTLDWAKDVISRQVGHIVRLVDDLLDISRVIRGKISLQLEKVNLKTIVQNAIDEVQFDLEAKQHHFESKLPEENIWLNADPVRLTQILSNLLTNAIKYTDAHGRIVLNVETTPTSVIIGIRDNGIGIYPQLLETIFIPFTQFTHSIDRSSGGLGIGLALVKKLVELHGGKIAAKSTGLGKGSEFVFELARLTVDNNGLPQPWKPDIVAKRRILVVDDNRGAAITMSKLLNKIWGHEVAIAYSGREAIAKVNEWKPEIVFLDIGLPELSGYEVAVQLRSEAANDCVTLVALTGYGQDEDRQKSKDVGINEHMVKPVSVQTLQKFFQLHDTIQGNSEGQATHSRHAAG